MSLEVHKVAIRIISFREKVNNIAEKCYCWTGGIWKKIFTYIYQIWLDNLFGRPTFSTSSVCITTCFRSILTIFLFVSLFLIYLHLHIWNNFFCWSRSSLVQNEQCRLRLISPGIRAIICLMEYFIPLLYITRKGRSFYRSS